MGWLLSTHFSLVSELERKCNSLLFIRVHDSYACCSLLEKFHIISPFDRIYVRKFTNSTSIWRKAPLRTIQT